MLLQLENPNKENVRKLLDFARQNQLNLVIIDNEGTDYSLPGKPLDDSELFQLIEDGRKTQHIEINTAHSLIRNRFNGD